MKRARGDRLTGGSGDVNPQTLVARVTESAADTTTSQEVNLPVPQIPVAGQATIFEILRIFVNWGTALAGTGAAETEYQRVLNISTKSFGTTVASASDPNVILRHEQERRGAFTAAQSYQVALPIEPFQFDYTDGAGHGVLVAVQKIYLQADSANTGVAQSAIVRIIYRLKTVTIEEYVGIVQSQQG